MSSSPISRTTFLYLTLAAAAWGIGTVVSKRAVVEIPPLTLLPIQLGASLAVLLLLTRWRGLPIRGASVPPVLGRLGVLNPGLAYALSLVGLVQVSASLSVMLWAIEPILILVLAAVFLGERVGRSVVGLSGVALGGMLLLIYQPGTAGTVSGVLVTVAGVGCCATYTVITRRFLSSAGSTAQVVVTQQLYAFGFALVLLGAIWGLRGPVLPVGLTVPGVISAIASGGLYYGLAYWFYLSGLRHVPASIASVSFYLIPVFGLAGAVALLGEGFEARQWVGVVIVLGALALVARPVRAPRIDACPPTRS